LLLIVASTTIVADPARLRGVCRRHVGVCVAGAAALTISVASAMWWTHAADTNAPEANMGLGSPLTGTLKQVPAWILQSIASFPLRNEQAPTVVYVLGLIVFCSVVGLALRIAGRRMRIGIVLTCAMALLTPAILTWATYSQMGAVWQGRYTLPYAVGVILLAGVVLDEDARFSQKVAVPLAAITFLAGHLVSVMNVLLEEREDSPLAGTGAWMMPPAWVVVLLTVAGATAWLFAVWAKQTAPASPMVRQSPLNERVGEADATVGMTTLLPEKASR